MIGKLQIEAIQKKNLEYISAATIRGNNYKTGTLCMYVCKSSLDKGLVLKALTFGRLAAQDGMLPVGSFLFLSTTETIDCILL